MCNMSMLKDRYKTTVLPELKTQFGHKNDMQAAHIEKVTLNVGLSSKQDAKFIEVIEDTLTRISGQKPVRTKARKSIAGFKIRKDNIVGCMVTLRGERMWDFIDRLVNVAFPRIRDFRGISEKSVDRSGNFNYGFKEHTAFPEINANEVESLHGLQVVITTTTSSREEGLSLFKGLGFPFIKKQQK